MLSTGLLRLACIKPKLKYFPVTLYQRRCEPGDFVVVLSIPEVQIENITNVNIFLDTLLISVYQAASVRWVILYGYSIKTRWGRPC